MLGIWFGKIRGVLRLSRAERALTLAIFLLFQAMLPSYANALSNWSGEDQLVLCTSHGLITVDTTTGDETVLEGETMCLVAQSAAADLAQVPPLPHFQVLERDASPLVLQGLLELRRGLHLSPHAPRAPPQFS